MCPVRSVTSVSDCTILVTGWIRVSVEAAYFPHFNLLIHTECCHYVLTNHLKLAGDVLIL